ncbi:hypothetical protein EG68_10274 [Paragonimus skrjabini miyazakii]|uniref:Uncharacterized protein n=1 Tax=Paragonimus skrjabini miyazakii TaxID=59628 RepID=A0A8S9YMW2_9TREM|nr:hypothetical protein EG68_10274 [Paragonimus skrjabini miyazakii]
MVIWNIVVVISNTCEHFPTITTRHTTTLVGMTTGTHKRLNNMHKTTLMFMQYSYVGATLLENEIHKEQFTNLTD